MKGSVLVVALILGHFLHGSEEREWSACRGHMFHDCFEYCRNNTECDSADHIQCYTKCTNGCGCKEAFIIRNNGGCVQLKTCLQNLEGDEEEDGQAETPDYSSINEHGIWKLNDAGQVIHILPRSLENSQNDTSVQAISMGKD